MQSYNFEEYRSEGPRFNTGISLGKSDRFYIGKGLAKKHHLDMMYGVRIFYDKTKNAVGFKFISTNEEGVVPLKKLRDDSLYINAKAFLGLYSIDSEMYAGKYKPIEITDSSGEKIFVIELKMIGF